MLLAAALLVSPLAVDDAAAVGVISGLVLAATTPFGGSRSHRFGGGWVALLNDGGGKRDGRQTHDQAQRGGRDRGQRRVGRVISRAFAGQPLGR